MAGRSIGVAAGLFGLTLALTGCSGKLDAADVEARVSEQFQAQTGEAPDSVDCPEDLPAEQGAEIGCEVVMAGQPLGITVTVSSIEGSTVNLDIQVDE